MGSQNHGRTDIFYRIPLSFPQRTHKQLLARIPLVWAILCRRHPLLASYILDLTPDLDLPGPSPQEPEPERTYPHAEPHFVFYAPETPQQLINDASSRVLFFSEDWAASYASEQVDKDACVNWMKDYLWNGPRRFLRQDQPYGLARVLVFPQKQSLSAQPAESNLDVILCFAHCISDGLSVSALASEFISLLASSNLPDPQAIAGFKHGQAQEELANGWTPQYDHVTDEMAKTIATDPVSTLTHSAAQSHNSGSLSAESFESLLPPALELTFPSIPTLDSSPARKRWYWAIRQIVLQNRSQAAVNMRLTPFVAQIPEEQSGDSSEAADEYGARTFWSVIRLDADTTRKLIPVAKRKGVRIGSLLYAITACVINQIHKETPSDSAGTVKAEQPSHTVVGFPFSVRRWLKPESTLFGPLDGTSSKPVPSEMAVRLGFGGVPFPASDAFSLSDQKTIQDFLESDAPSIDVIDAIRLWQMARHAQSHFDRMFVSPADMLGDSFLSALERANRFRSLGSGDVFETKHTKENQDEKGADERQPGLAKKNMQGPGSSLNFSMVGQLDGTIPAAIPLPSSLCQGEESLTVRDGLMFGVRCRSGEVFGTSFTFRGQLNLEMGHDKRVWSTPQIERFLYLIKAILKALAQ